MKKYFLFFVLINIFITTSFSCHILPDQKKITTEAFDFKETLMNTNFYSENESFQLSEEIKNHDFTILNFWFPSCSPCREEIPDLNNFYIKNKNTISLLGIQLIGLDSKREGEKFLIKYGVEYPSVADLEGELTVKYLVKVFPTTIFINNDGKIVKTWEGIINESNIQEILDTNSGNK